MKRALHFIDELSSRRWLLHLVFWSGVLVLYVLFFGRRNSNYSQTFLFVGMLMPVIIATSYFLNYVLIPRYLLKERFGYFILYFIYTIIAAVYIEMLIVIFIFIVMAEAKVKNMSPASVDILFVLAALLLVVFLGGAIKLLQHWRESKERHNQLMQDKIAAELKFLKTQLNPHFLFNTLNNLYYLSTQKSDKAPQAIMALSEILDYVMHSGKRMFVPLLDELKQVDNYIALEQLRYEDRVEVVVNRAGDVSSCVIAPMVLITLLENAFKHGVMSDASQSWIRVDVVKNADHLNISIANSRPNRQQGNGIGLENMREQLRLLYRDAFSLEIGEEENVYTVQLQLNQPI